MIEGVASFVVLIGIIYLIWHLHRTGKQIIQHQRHLEDKGGKT